MLTDYLAAEPLIVDRLRDQVAGVPDMRVFGAADLAGVEARAQHTPALHVVYDGDEPLGEAGQSQSGDTQIAWQRWIVWVVARSARDARGGTGARAVAGPLMAATIQALAGWRPSADHSPMIRGAAGRPAYDAGIAYYPQLYRTAVVL